MVMKLFTLVIVCQLSSLAAWAIEIREELNVSGQPVSQWIILQNQNKLKILPATSVRQGDITIVSSTVNALEENILFSAVVQLASGEIISSPFHSWSGSELIKNNNQIKSETQIENLKAEIQRLEYSLKDLTNRKRHEAGFDKVNEVYEKINEFEDQNRALRLAYEDFN